MPTLELPTLEVVGQEAGDISEPGDVGRIDLHQRLVRLEADTGQFGLGRLGPADRVEFGLERGGMLNQSEQDRKSVV